MPDDGTASPRAAAGPPLGPAGRRRRWQWEGHHGSTAQHTPPTTGQLRLRLRLLRVGRWATDEFTILVTRCSGFKFALNAN